MRSCQLMLAWEPLLLSTQCVIFLRLKTLLKHVGFGLFFTQFHEAFECKNPAIGSKGRSTLGQGSYATAHERVRPMLDA